MRTRGKYLIGLLWAASATAARADTPRGVDAQMFRPSLDSYGIFTVDSAQAGKQWDFGFKLMANYAQAPLTTDMPGVAGEKDKLLNFDATFDFGAHLAILQGKHSGLELGFDVPIHTLGIG